MHTHVRLSVNGNCVIRSRPHLLCQLPLPAFSELNWFWLGSLQLVHPGYLPANSLGLLASWARSTTDLLPLDGNQAVQPTVYAC